MLAKVKEQIRKIRIKNIRLRTSLSADQLQISSKNIIIAPHPDDEILGCAGLIQRILLKGKNVYIVFLTGGEGSHNECCNINSLELIQARRGLAIAINRKLGVPIENLFFLDYPDGKINYKYQETNKLKQIIKKIHPNSIFIPHTKEGWSDHLQAGNIIRKLIKNNNDIQLYEYCVWFWYYNTWRLDWKSTFLLSLTKTEHAKKNEAIDVYISTKAPCGKPWSGVLPKLFVYANRWKKELFFKTK